MQYLAAARMGNVLETFTDVCCCDVVRSALYRDWSDSSLLECVQGKCSESVLTVLILNCLWGCGVWKLVCWLQWYVAVTVLQLAAMLWTHWALTVVKISKRENSWSCSFTFLCHVLCLCCVGSEVSTASIIRMNVCHLCVECVGALLGLLLWTSLLSAVHLAVHFKRLFTVSQFTMSTLTCIHHHIPTCWP